MHDGQPPGIGRMHFNRRVNVRNRRHSRQGGAASIEFAAVFVLFFMLFYGMVGYCVPLLLGASYQEIAVEALREAIRPAAADATPPDHQRAAALVVDDSWLPANWAQLCDSYPDGYLKVSGDIWSVCIRHAAPATIIPPVSLFGWRIPALPEEVRGEAVIQLR